jgi:hypothetical protein
MNKGFILGATALLVATGCTRPTTVVQTQTPAPTVIGEGATAPSIDQVPSTLRHDAFEYYGLANPEPIHMELIQPGASPRTGSQLRRLKEIRDGEAIFEVEHTGELAALLGTMEVAVRNDGIYALGSSLTTGATNDLELPADLGSGRTWQMDRKVERSDGQSLHHTGSFKVVGTERVTTPAGEFEALRLESSGSVQQGAQALPMQTRSWYVRGKGVVRMEIDTTIDGKKSTVRIEASQPPAGTPAGNAP